MFLPKTLNRRVFLVIVGMLEVKDCSYEKILPWIRKHIVET